MDRIVTLSWRDREKLDHLDLESLGIHIRSAMHKVGSVMLDKLFNSDGVVTGEERCSLRVILGNLKSIGTR